MQAREQGGQGTVAHRPLPQFPVAPALGAHALEIERVFSQKQSKSAGARRILEGVYTLRHRCSCPCMPISSTTPRRRARPPRPLRPASPNPRAAVGPAWEKKHESAPPPHP
jgi:hypothetical protein